MSRVLILGGCGFVARHFVNFLVREELASHIRVVDKKIPCMADLSERLEAIYDNEELVDFIQADLSRDADVHKAFHSEAPWDLVVNLAAETQLGCDPAVYRQHVTDVAIKCGQVAAENNVPKFIQMSTASVYGPDRKSSTEETPIAPWTALSKAHAAAEEGLRAIAGLPLVILRPAIVYGPGDVRGLMPRIVVGRVYKKLGEKMKLLHDKDQRINTVHVRDVAKAIWHAGQTAEVGSVFNLSDGSDFSIGKMNELLRELFGINITFVNAVVNAAARAAMGVATRTVNDKHMKPWTEICRETGITNTCLSPFLHTELLADNSVCIDGSAITASGFSYRHARPTLGLISEEVAYMVALNHFPKL